MKNYIMKVTFQSYKIPSQTLIIESATVIGAFAKALEYINQQEPENKHKVEEIRILTDTSIVVNI